MAAEADPRITQWLAELAAFTDEPPGLTRTFLSPALERAKGWLADRMAAAGLAVYEDQAGNLIGRWDCGDADAGTLASGSHLDTVRNAGRFDGAMGVVAALLAAERAIATQPRHHVEVVAFSDEEGVRFQTTYLGSRWYVGTLGAHERAFADASGVTVERAIATHRPRFPAPPPRRLLGYVEAHIEQGPVLEARGLALGVVTDIAGQTRARITVTGRAGHAGTTPMHLRRDALAGAAEAVLLIEERARATAGLVATVGQLEVASAASNVIPGAVTFSLDARSGDDGIRHAFCRRVFAEIETRLTARHLAVAIDVPLEAPATPCHPAFTERLAALVVARQSECPRLVSGAGHDAVAIAEVAPTGMIFVRCREGLSHHPDEFAATADIALAVDVLAEFLFQ